MNGNLYEANSCYWVTLSHGVCVCVSLNSVLCAGISTRGVARYHVLARPLCKRTLFHLFGSSLGMDASTASTESAGPERVPPQRSCSLNVHTVFNKEGGSMLACVLQTIWKDTMQAQTNTGEQTSFVATPVLCLGLLISISALSSLFSNWNQFG